MSELDDATATELHALSCRTPLEDSLLAVTAAMSAGTNLEGSIILVDGDLVGPTFDQAVDQLDAYQSVADAKRSGGNRVAVL